MQGIEEIIIQLLLRHNCVVVPGFGGFVAKQISANLDIENGVIHPPKKALLFNRFLLTDDGLLLAEYARTHGLFYEEAKKKLEQYTDHLQRELLAGQRIKFAKLGSFTRHSDGQIIFEQDRFFNLLMSSYGLGTLSFVALEHKEQAQAPVFTLEEKPQRQVKWARVAAAACLLPLAFYSFWIPTKTTALQSGLFSSKDFNPFYELKAPLYKKTTIGEFKTLETIEPTLSFEKAQKEHIETYVWQPGFVFNVKIPAKPQEQSQIIPQLKNDTKFSTRYHYIVGCFSNYQNAKNLQSKLLRDGFNAQLIESGALTKVSAGNGQNPNDLQQIRLKADSLGMRGWIYKN